MRKKQIDSFFNRLDRALDKRAQIILVGASAGTLMGHIRPSVDIDFEIRPTSRIRLRDPDEWDRAIKDTAQAMGVAVNYSADISHWSMVSYLDYRKTALPYKTFGKLAVKLIAPQYWTIGKMARFIRTDIEDIVKIIRVKKLSWQKLTSLWAKAVLDSVLSLELGQFRQHVVTFIKEYGKRCWGRDFTPDEAIRAFDRKSVSSTKNRTSS